MKKFIGVIISLLMFVPMVVLADMSGPMVREFEFEVTNPNGATLYDSEFDEDTGIYSYNKTNKNVSYGYKFKVSEAIEIDEYVYVEKYDGYIKSSDGRAIVDNFKITEKELGTKYNIIALKDLDIKKGPSAGYNSTGTIIKAGTKSTARVILECDDEGECNHSESDPWLYVEYNKVKGYILAYEGSVGFDIGKKTGITNIKTELYKEYVDAYDNKQAPIAMIPANTKITSQTYSLDMWINAYYIEYNGQKGFVSSYNYVIESDPVTYTTVKELKVYETLDTDSNDNITSKVVGTIPAGTSGESKYWQSENSFESFRYEKGSVKGWTYIPTYEEGNEDYNSSDLVDIKYPWDDEEADDDEEEYENIENEVDDEEIEDNEENSEPIEDDAPYEPYTIPRRKSSMDIVYICIAAAAIIAMTAAVTITYVNKKKKNKVEEK